LDRSEHARPGEKQRIAHEALAANELKRLLVGTDLSPRADVALRRAARIAVDQRAALTLFHAVVAGGDDSVSRQFRADAEAFLLEKIDKLGLPPTIAVKACIGTGEPVSEILRQAREEAAELIVLGAHGTNAVRDLFLGSTAEKVVRKGDRPVLIVKHGNRKPYRRVLVPVDFSECSLRALEFALRLAPHAQFHVLHAYRGFEGQLLRAGIASPKILRYRREVARRERHEMNLFLRRIGRSRPIKSLLRHGRAPDVIMKAVERLHPDLVAVGTSGRTGAPYLLLGSVAEHVLREVPCDVLVRR
jgi:universal stress protein E